MNAPASTNLGTIRTWRSRGGVDSRLDSRVGVFFIRFLEALDLKLVSSESHDIFQLIFCRH